MPKIKEQSTAVVPQPMDDQVYEVAQWLHDVQLKSRSDGAAWVELSEKARGMYANLARKLFTDTPVCLMEWITEQLLRD